MHEKRIRLDLQDVPVNERLVFIASKVEWLRPALFDKNMNWPNKSTILSFTVENVYFRKQIKGV